MRPGKGRERLPTFQPAGKTTPLDRLPAPAPSQRGWSGSNLFSQAIQGLSEEIQAVFEQLEPGRRPVLRPVYAHPFFHEALSKRRFAVG
jgi:hypothetical protein